VAYKILINLIHNGVEYKAGDIVEEVDKILIEKKFAEPIPTSEDAQKRKKK